MLLWLRIVVVILYRNFLSFYVDGMEAFVQDNLQEKADGQWVSLIVWRRRKVLNFNHSLFFYQSYLHFNYFPKLIKLKIM